MKSKIYIHISSGRGPVECCWVVDQLVKEVIADCKEKKLEVSVLERNPGPESRTLVSALLLVSGEDINQKLKEWEGTIQWIGKSHYRKFNKRKNWFVSISLICTEESNSLTPKDINYKTYKASGPGGQHRNKVESAVRAIHVPTGIFATASESRSQNMNKHEALRKLRTIFENQLITQQKKMIESKWLETTTLERGNAKKVYKGREFKLKK